MKYGFTGETKVYKGVTLRQIVAAENLKYKDEDTDEDELYIESGEVGGWIENESNLSQDG